MGTMEKHVIKKLCKRFFWHFSIHEFNAKFPNYHAMTYANYNKENVKGKKENVQQFCF